jgi:ubiquitin carboxyl-terminal hydrolase 34
MTLVLIALETPKFATVAQDSYATVLEASLHSRKIWEAFTRHADVNRVHQMLLLVQPEQAIREHVARKITSICGGDLPSTCPVTKPEIASRLWTVISAILPDVKQYPGQSEQLFEIAEHVFRTNDEYDRNEEHLRSLLTQWSSLLLEHEHKEFPGRDEVDHVVLGLTKLLLCCILSIKSFKKPVNAGSLMSQVFKKYIFISSTQAERELPGSVPLPILESHTRQELYDLMLGLAEDSNTYDTLLQLAGEVDNDKIGPLLSPILVDRSMEIRSSTGYVGLYNPRAICYMNSLLTQLFMNVNFRQFMLSLDVKEASGSQRLLFETQRLFAQMQNSFRKSTDPRSFAACVKSLDKTPIDITVQMDADEFYNLLFDQWEGQLLTQEHKEKFRSFYGGQTLNQIKSKECEHVSERAEPFFAVQCDIAGKANLQDSLQAYVQGDVMEGDNKYKCESCDGKFVDAVKRTCLKDAPDNLIFHLKRFEFDLNDFSRRKIYDHFAFPVSLDISPYKIDHLADSAKPREEDWYDLVGVLVHTGTCENGHYYSYIRERPCSNGSTSPTWIEFNDSDVGPFDHAEIAERTFGGFTVEGDGYVRQTKQFSAYMLFYQRRAAIDEDQCRWVSTSSDHASQITIPKSLNEETNVNNELFIREYSLFDPVHERFLRQLHATSRTIHHGTCSESHDQEKRALHIVLAHLGHIAWRQYNVEIFLDLLLQLRRSMLSCTTCCKIALQWLAIDDHAVTNILVKCSHPKIRSEARALFIAGLKYLREKDPTVYGIDGTDSDMEVDSTGSSECVLSAITQRLRTTADETMESTRGWEDYYLMLTQMAAMGPMETAVLLNFGFLYFCLKLFCMNAHPPFRNETPELARIMEKRRGIFNRLICFLWTLLSQMDLSLPVIDDSRSYDRQATIDPERMKFPLSTKERPVLVWWSDDLKAIAVLDKILETFDDTKVDHFYPGDIVGWVLEAPEVATQTHLCRTMIEGVQLDPPYCNAYIRAALPFCEACPKGENINKVINSIAKAIASPARATEDRLPGGLHVVRFFDGLLKAENESLFERKHPHAFHHLLMIRSRTYAIPLLCHYEDAVRKESATFFEQLYDNEDAIPPETVLVKYTTARELLSDLMHKFAYEKEVGRNRSFLVPLVDTCRLFVRLLYVLSQTQTPDTQQFQDVNDTALIYQFQQEVEARMRSWPHDEGTPMSQGETFEQSEYGSESDDAHELLDN